MIAYCGLLCDTCPVHLATIEKDLIKKRAMRESIAEQCFSKYGMKLEPEDIGDCDGCMANAGRIFSGCLSCEIRKCAGERKVESCAYCDDYICKKLNEHFLSEPDAQKRLEKYWN
jgi:hypothetical protein